MMSVLGMNCGCGKRVQIDCPTVGDIPQASAKLDDLGWGFDERGRVVCPDCRARTAEQKVTEEASE